MQIATSSLHFWAAIANTFDLRMTRLEPADEIAAGARATIPAGRYGAPREFADVVCFLASDRASYMTGGLVRVDGGAIRSV
jgi:NAD(P)-dependent dehydrogenase (short-subunit alcohol dehydrogenase family)